MEAVTQVQELHLYGIQVCFGGRENRYALAPLLDDEVEVEIDAENLESDIT